MGATGGGYGSRTRSPWQGTRRQALQGATTRGEQCEQHEREEHGPGRAARTGRQVRGIAAHAAVPGVFVRPVTRVAVLRHLRAGSRHSRSGRLVRRRRGHRCVMGAAVGEVPGTRDGVGQEQQHQSQEEGEGRCAHPRAAG